MVDGVASGAVKGLRGVAPARFWGWERLFGVIEVGQQCVALEFVEMEVGSAVRFG